MKIKYEFVTGETIEVEVNDCIGEVCLEIERLEQNEARRIRYNERHVDTNDDYDNWNTCFDEAEKEEFRRKFEEVFNSLTDEQKRLIDALFGLAPMTEKAYGKELGISQQAVHKRLQTIRKIFKNNF